MKKATAVLDVNHALLSDGFDFNFNFCSPGVVEGRVR